MASRRMIPTRFFKDPDILALSSKDTQLILIGLTLAADDEGREVAHASLLGREMDYPPEQIERALQELEANDLLVLYWAGKHRYYFLTRWNEWQTLGTKKRPSKYPAPPLPENVDEGRPADPSTLSCHHGLETDRADTASRLPAFSGICPQHPSQENRRESKRTEEEGEARVPSIPSEDRAQAKVIPFPPPPAAPATVEERQKHASFAATLVPHVAQILKLDGSDALTRLVTEYACYPSLSLLGEADAAREWIDDATRNRNGSRMTLAFFRRWLQRAQTMNSQCLTTQSPQPMELLAATGTAGAESAVHAGWTNARRGHFPSLMNLVDLDQQARRGQS